MKALSFEMLHYSTSAITKFISQELHAIYSSLYNPLKECSLSKFGNGASITASQQLLVSTRNC